MGGQATAGPTRVLVVDDNVVVRRLLAGRLRGTGCQVSEAVDGLAALEEFRRAPAEVVITDLSMPRLDGLELLAELRSRETPPEVVLLTGGRVGDADVAARALRLGAHEYIPKTPRAMEAIVLAVQRAAERWRLREENVRLVAELRRTSLTDGLTGLGNRRAFDEALPRDITRARRQDGRLALVMLDIDHFEAVNDGVGRAVGNQVLVAFTLRLRSVTREADRLFRYGGDEFALLVSGADPAVAMDVAGRVVRATSEATVRVGAHAVAVTCSAGVSVLAPDDGGGGSGLVARADAALSAAKRTGRNRAVAFDPVAPGSAETPEGAC